ERPLVSHAAAILPSNDVQALMQAVFDTPVVAIGGEHLLRVHLRPWPGSHQIFYFGVFGWLTRDLNGTSELSGLFGKRGTDASGTDGKGPQAAVFGSTAIDFRGLSGGRLVQRGKMRATDGNRVLARWWRLQVDCL